MQENPQITDPEGRYGRDVPQGLWMVVYAQTSPGGAALARTFWFTPAARMASGSTYLVTVHRVVQSYAGQMMTADYQADVVMPAADGNPPVISGQTPAGGSRVKVILPEIRASVSDPSGIDASRITLTLDGGVAAHSFDPVAGLVSFIPGASLAEGAHTVSLSVTDAAGNTATAPAWSFTVDTTRPGSRRA